MKLNEERQTRIADFVKELNKLEFVDKILEFKGLPDGFTVFIRGSDGNAYELEIRPAARAKGHRDIRKSDQYVQRKNKQRDKIRKSLKLVD